MRFCLAVEVAVALLIVSVAHAADTTNFTYDALGRLTTLQISGGSANGAQAQYQFNATGNRVSYTVTGSTAGSMAVIRPLADKATASATGVVLGVRIDGSPPLTGTVIFSERGTFLGSTVVRDGEATLILEGFAPGSHIVNARYSGDVLNAPRSYDFTITVEREANTR